jgi:tRNA1(Val) A37 N6-methylase TrmN6
MTDAPFTDDTLLDGRIKLRQPAHGYRAAIDPILLAAALPATAKQALELGCGAGAASLCALARLADIAIVGVEIDPATAELARFNAGANGFGARFRVDLGDVRTIGETGFDLVFANPPYLPAERSTLSPDPHKRRSNHEGAADLGDWIAAALRSVRPGGSLVFIQRADRLDALLAHLHGHAGEQVVFPLWPRAGTAAKRVLVRARKGIATPLRLAAGLALHEADGRYTAEADAILRGRTGLALD